MNSCSFYFFCFKLNRCVFRSSAFNRGDFAAGSVQQASYGTVSVSVCRGDVTKETSDVIINGVMDRNFDLTRGDFFCQLLLLFCDLNVFADLSAKSLKTLLSAREVRTSIPCTIKLGTVSPTARQSLRRSFGAVLPRR